MYTEEQQKKLILAKKMLMWGYIAAMTMMFMGLTSAYLIKRQDTQNWISFEMPKIFIINTIVILLSSVLLYIAERRIKYKNYKGVSFLLWGTTFLGIIFIIGQFLGWQELIKQKVFLVGNPGGSFIYIFTGLHMIHLIGAIIAMLIVAIVAIVNVTRLSKGTLLYNVSLFWHSLGVLWLYLFIFLFLNQN